MTIVRPKETLEDIILQIWNDGAEGIVYGKKDIKEFEGRIRKSFDQETQHNN